VPESEDSTLGSDKVAWQSRYDEHYHKVRIEPEVWARLVVIARMYGVTPNHLCRMVLLTYLEKPYELDCVKFDTRKSA
jgi:hypothetical protein